MARLSPKKEEELCRSLSWSLSAGMTLDESLEAASDRFPWLDDVRMGLLEGASLAQAVDATQKLRPSTVAFLKAGEATGHLSQSLKWAAYDATLRNKIKQTLINACLYPGFLLIMTAVAFVFLTVVALPRYETLFRSTGAQPPALTAGLFVVGKFLRAQGWWFGPLLVMLLVLFFASSTWKKIVVQLPFVGRFFGKLDLLRALSLFVGALQSGMDLHTSLLIVAEGCERSSNRVMYQSMADDLTLGMDPFQSPRLSESWPSWLLAVVRLGEKSGKLAPAFQLALSRMTEELETEAKRLAVIAEPVFLLGLGAFVGLTLWGLFQPLLATVSLLSR